MKRSPSPTPTASTHASNSPFLVEAPSSPSAKKAKKSPEAKYSRQPKIPKKTTTAVTKKAPREGPRSEKGKLVAMIIQRGVKGMDKAEAETITGLRPAQIKQMLRTDGKGALHNALMKVAEDM